MREGERERDVVVVVVVVVRGKAFQGAQHAAATQPIPCTPFASRVGSPRPPAVSRRDVAAHTCSTIIIYCSVAACVRVHHAVRVWVDCDRASEVTTVVVGTVRDCAGRWAVAVSVAALQDRLVCSHAAFPLCFRARWIRCAGRRRRCTCFFDGCALLLLVLLRCAMGAEMGGGSGCTNLHCCWCGLRLHVKDALSLRVV